MPTTKTCHSLFLHMINHWYLGYLYKPCSQDYQISISQHSAHRLVRIDQFIRNHHNTTSQQRNQGQPLIPPNSKPTWHPRGSRCATSVVSPWLSQAGLRPYRVWDPCDDCEHGEARVYCIACDGGYMPLPFQPNGIKCYFCRDTTNYCLRCENMTVVPVRYHDVQCTGCITEGVFQAHNQ